MGKKKQAPQQTDLDLVRSMHPDMPYRDPEQEREDAEAAAKAAANVDVVALQRQIADMQAQLITAQRTNSALMTQAAVPLAPQRPREVSYDDLPDPAIDPKAYGAELHRRIREYDEANRAVDQWEAEQTNRAKSKYSALWDQFRTKYREYGKNEKLAEFAAIQVATEANARGIDVDKYMFASSDQFMDDVTKYMRDNLGFAVDGGSEDDDDDDIEPVRTTGVFGGQESGGKATRRAETDAAPRSMFDDLRDWQAKTGFHR